MLTCISGTRLDFGVPQPGLRALQRTAAEAKSGTYLFIVTYIRTIQWYTEQSYNYLILFIQYL